MNFGEDIDQTAVVKLKFNSGNVIELPLEGKAGLGKTVGQLKKEQFSNEEKGKLALIHDGIKLGDKERIVDLLTPHQKTTQIMESPKSQVITINIEEDDGNNIDFDRTFEPDTPEDSAQKDLFQSPKKRWSFGRKSDVSDSTNRSSDLSGRKSNPTDVTPRGKKVQAEGLELLKRL